MLTCQPTFRFSTTDHVVLSEWRARTVLRRVNKQNTKWSVCSPSKCLCLVFGMPCVKMQRIKYSSAHLSLRYASRLGISDLFFALNVLHIVSFSCYYAFCKELAGWMQFVKHWRCSTLLLETYYSMHSILQRTWTNLKYSTAGLSNLFKAWTSNAARVNAWGPQLKIKL